MDIILVHITDIHIRDNEDLDVLNNRVPSICGVIGNHITEPDETELIFCITGDVAYSGLKDQYDNMNLILDEINSKIIDKYSKVNIQYVFVPGNHDCDFTDSSINLRNAILNSAELDISDSIQLNICTGIENNFFTFLNQIKNEYKAVGCKSDKILTVYEKVISRTNLKLSFHCLNTSWCSKKSEVKGKMHISSGKMEIPFNNLEDKDADEIVVIMMHHDAEWMDWRDIDIWDKYHKKYADIILVGHDHKVEYTLRQNYDESSNYYIKGNQFYDKDRIEQSGFNIIKLHCDSKSIQENFFTYEWKETLYKKVIDTGYRPFIRNRFHKSGVYLKQCIVDMLEEMDIDISCGGKKDIKLSDVFGFPTLKDEKGKNTVFYRDMTSFVEYIKDKKYIAINGQKEYGKTALIKQLFKYFFEKKKYPLLLDISKVNTADGEGLNRIIEQSYKDMYENIDTDEVMQKDASERICLIDNFEEVKLTDSSSKKFLQYLSVKFGYVVITRNQSFDILNTINYVEMNDYINSNYRSITIQPTKSTSRERIVNKWLQLNCEEDKNSVAFDAKRKEKYSQLQAVMKSNYFNKTPMDLLLVLSYLEEDHARQLDYSKFSYVYDELILKKLTDIVRADSGSMTNNISVYKTILQNLAYTMYTSDIQGSVSESYVYEVIIEYQKNHFNSKLNISTVINRLEEYKFLEKNGDTYRFKHSYVYYYFIGSYIIDVLEPMLKEQVIREIFKNINCDVNYNIALFLAYRLNIEHEILPLIKEFATPLLQKYSDFKYDSIRKMIDNWKIDIEKKISEIYYNVPENEEIPILRERYLKRMEENEDEDNQLEKQDVDNTLNEITEEVLRLSRYIDYIGNILKNYSGKMDNKIRNEGIDFIFISIIKIIGSFCDLSAHTVDRIVAMFDKKIQDGDEEIASVKSKLIEKMQQFFLDLLITFIEANLFGFGCSLDCDILKENIDAYTNENNSEFLRMAKVEYLMRTAYIRLPVREISDLYKGKNSLSAFSRAILKDNIYRYLTSFQYDSSDRQSICSILEFNNKDLRIQGQKVAIASKR